MEGPHRTMLDKVRALIERLSPDAICDDCIATRLELSGRQHASHTTRELAGANGFERSKDVCTLCGDTRQVIRRRQSGS